MSLFSKNMKVKSILIIPIFFFIACGENKKDTSDQQSEVKEMYPIETGKEGTDTLRQWVKIGETKYNSKSILKLYKKIEHIPGISVFKKSNAEWFLYKSFYYFHEEQLVDSLKQITVEMEKYNESAKAIDFETLCRKKEIIIEIEPIIFKKEKIEIRCSACSK